MPRGRTVVSGCCAWSPSPAVLSQRLPALPVHAGLHLRDGAPGPEPPHRLQRPDLPRARRLLRAGRLHVGDHDRPLGRALRVDDPGRRRSCFLVGFLFGIPALRLEGLYLALATFALALAVPQILKYFEHWTGGSQGIVLSKPRAPSGLRLTRDQWLYFVALAVLLVLVPRRQPPSEPRRAGRSWRSATTPSPPGRWASTPRSTSR